MNNDESAASLEMFFLSLVKWTAFSVVMELFDTKNSEVVWSNRWQTNWSDLSTIKETCHRNFSQFNIMVTKNAEQVNVTGNPEAYEYYLKGKYKFDKRTT